MESRGISYRNAYHLETFAPLSCSQIQQLLAEADMDNEGSVTLQEFTDVMRRLTMDDA